MARVASSSSLATTRSTSPGAALSARTGRVPAVRWRAPVRWATPGTEVPWTKCPAEIAAACSQDASTPPPSPPSAAIRSVMGLASGMRSLRRHESGCRLPAAAEEAHERCRCPPLQPVPAARVLDDVDLREGGTELGRVRDLAAQPTAHAVVVDVGDGVGAQRVLAGL